MQVTGEVTLGTILVIVTIVAVSVRFHLGLQRYMHRLDRHEERDRIIANDLQRIIGRIDDRDRSPWPRNRRTQ